MPTHRAHQELRDSLTVRVSGVPQPVASQDPSSGQYQTWQRDLVKVISFLSSREENKIDFTADIDLGVIQRRFYRFKDGLVAVGDDERTLEDDHAGVSFHVTHRGGEIGPQALALLISQFCKDHHGSSNKPLTPRAEKRCFCFLLTKYCQSCWQKYSSWKRETDPLSRWPWPYVDPENTFVEGNPITIQFLLRYVSLFPKDNDGVPMSEIKARKQIEIKGSDHLTSLWEQEHLLVMRFFPCGEKSRFSMISIGGLRWTEPTGEWVKLPAHQIPGPLTPLVLFIHQLRLLLITWTATWAEVLNDLEKLVSLELSQINDDDRIERLMFDRFDKRHHTIVEETKRDLRDWHFKVFHTITSNEYFLRGSQKDNTIKPQYIHALRKQWKNLGDNFVARIDETLSRIKEKQADISSLSDNMFNATSIREAHESTQLNRYVFVFTVVTVIYLPLTFVTAFFGMNNIPDDDPLYASMIPFGWILAVFCLSTYLFAIVFALATSIPWRRLNKKRDMQPRADPGALKGWLKGFKSNTTRGPDPEASTGAH